MMQMFESEWIHYPIILFVMKKCDLNRIPDLGDNCVTLVIKNDIIQRVFVIISWYNLGR